MSNYTNTKAVVAANVYTNNNNEVTAAMVKAAINEVIDTLIAGGYLYKGVAKPGDAAVSPDANVFYIATEAGTYTNKGGLVVADGEVAVLKYNGSWTKEVAGAATAAQVSQLREKVRKEIGNFVLAVTESGYYIKCNAGIGNSVGTKVPAASYCYIKYPVSAGDKIIVNGAGASEGRLWCFADANNIILDVAAAGATGSNLMITAPANSAYVLINSTIAGLGDCTFINPDSIEQRYGSYVDNPEYVRAYTDAAGRFLWGIKVDGSIEWAKGVPQPIRDFVASEIIAGRQFTDEQVASLVDLIATYYPYDDAEGRLSLTIDKDDRIVAYRKADGMLVEKVGIETPKINLSLAGLSDLADALRDSGFSPGGAGDWSEYLSNDGDNPLRLPLPKCAVLNIISDMDLIQLNKAGRGGATPGVNYDVPTEVQFWDMNGNYFKKWTLMSGQGDSSMIFEKKNIAFDFFDTEVDGDAFAVKFGDWVPQDSFHLKAYTNDAFRCIGLIAYEFYSQILATRPLNDTAPYMKNANKWGGVAWDTNDYMDMVGGHSKLKNNEDFEAKCMPAGFPVIVYQNGAFFGIYVWQIKKNRKNYHQDKKTATEIHLDGVLSASTIWSANGDNSQIGWANLQNAGFEIRNPKDSYLVLMNGTEYNADTNAGELIDETSPNYDPTNPNHIISKDVKASIVNLSKYMTELGVYEAAYQSAPEEQKSAALAELKEQIEARFNVSFMIDYLIAVNALQDGDSVAKNWQWTTWDGVLWTPNLYDCDCSLGVTVYGNMVLPVRNTLINAGATSPEYWVYEYYAEELETRYAKLRDAGIISTDNIIGLVRDFVARVGLDYFALEFDKWKNAPCNRPSGINEDYWELISQWSQGDPDYSDETDYAIGDTCVFGVQGTPGTYRFRCISPCRGEAPCSSYNNAIPYLGHYDSIYRLYDWEAQKLSALDTLFNY